jgi:hypothetical protein
VEIGRRNPSAAVMSSDFGRALPVRRQQAVFQGVAVGARRGRRRNVAPFRDAMRLIDREKTRRHMFLSQAGRQPGQSFRRGMRRGTCPATTSSMTLLFGAVRLLLSRAVSCARRQPPDPA